MAIDGARRARLKSLPLPEAEAVLRRMLGDEGAGLSGRLVSELAARCGGLPLALRLAAARLAVRTDLSVAALNARLADEQHCLDALRVDDMELRASFAVSYQDLARIDDTHRTLARTFLLFGQPGITEISGLAMTEALRLPSASVEWATEHLLDGHLIESTPSGRYRMNDLLRCYAREQAEMEPFSVDQRQLAGL
ncbi:hypothetical protein [Streptomyces marianii]|uniref:AfsR/SARP family transcriptional regulator n=1 Tax=Streptomyces marianii TaxID=1817406 RepID=A0A5R9E0E7_9ACTN|nr:hypothetical protein [Streptomyces marianii]TLQ43146.1 hypothetical protein FEF34_08330 [Streptomyces marianii]